MEVEVDVRAYEALSQNAHVADLAAITRALMTIASETRRVDRHPERVTQLASELQLTHEQATTPFGNALDVLSRGPESAPERALACALAAHAIAAHPPTQRDEEERMAHELLWLATHTPHDATGLLDRALGERAANLWGAIADHVRRIDQGTLRSLGRGEALVAAVALASSSTSGAATAALALATDVGDRGIARVLGARHETEPEEPMVGEMTSAPRGPVATAALALTGVLLAVHLLRLLGRVALAYKRPAQVTFCEQGGVRVKWRVEILGRTLRDWDVVVPRGALMRATREVRYPRVALYAGLVALAAGSYVGVSCLVDGVRATSPSLLASGLAIIALGLGLDFALARVAPGARARCTVTFVPRRGAPLCVGNVDVRRADAFLARLTRLER
jgi:hypothetical protein